MSEQRKLHIIPTIILTIFFIAFIPLLPLIISWRWDWREAWVFVAISILGFVVSRILAARRNPGLIEERARFMQHEDAAPGDRILAPMLGIGGGLILVIAGIDRLFEWPPAFDPWVKIGSFIVILAGYILSSYALIENRFFSGMIRIQSDRGQHVVSGGPYRWMRHPGYAGGLIANIATPILLDSVWAFLPVLFLIIVFVIRIRLEEKVLKENLEGYADYTKRVRYRLLPGVW